MGDKLSELRKQMGGIYDLQAAANVLSWDQQVNMPPGGAGERAAQLATLEELAHTKFVSDEFGATVEDVQAAVEDLDPDSDETRLVWRIGLRLDKVRRVPSEWVAEKSRTASLAMVAWQKARADSDFSQFEEHLAKMVDLQRQYTSFFKPYDHIYDPLLDEYEIGMKTAQVQEVFDDLRPKQVELIRRISESEQIDSSVLFQNYDKQMQWDFGVWAAEKIGYNFEHGRQDISAHPFTTTFGIGDVRITTRLQEDYFGSGFFATLHEAGHGMYEQGIDTALSRTLLADGTSLGVHESQSRLWENLVGRSRAFWNWAFPELQKSFPGEVGSSDMETFYRAVNRVKPSLIRVEADEATYNLHVMLRFELEIALMEESLEVSDLPAAWNDKVQEYLGLTPPNDAEGVLQDIHWSDGYFGYFPTYSIGNLIACQLWEAVLDDIPDLSQQIEKGQFAPLLGWMREKIHRHGGKLLPTELLQQITGGGLSAEPYLRYLDRKFSDLYSLS